LRAHQVHRGSFKAWQARVQLLETGPSSNSGLYCVRGCSTVRTASVSDGGRGPLDALATLSGLSHASEFALEGARPVTVSVSASINRSMRVSVITVVARGGQSLFV
jgi:hypothetical protein